MNEKQVLEIREDLIKFFNRNDVDVSVTIGGSYALKKYYPNEFANRIVHDYDMIVNGNTSEILRAITLLKTSKPFISGGSYNYSFSFHFYYKDNVKIDILIDLNDKVSGVYQPLENIIRAKKNYIRKALELDKPIRMKDVEDYLIWIKTKDNIVL